MIDVFVWFFIAQMIQKETELTLGKYISIDKALLSIQRESTFTKSCSFFGANVGRYKSVQIN